MLVLGRRPAPEKAGPGQESVWDYPRPPRAERVHRRAVLRHAGAVVASSDDLVRVLETSHPPTYYLPRTAFTEGMLAAVERRTFCEWKGIAHYVDISVPGAEPLRSVGWWYPEPDARYPELTDRVAVYVAQFDEIRLGSADTRSAGAALGTDARSAGAALGEVVRPQPGGFYGGWVTDEVVGPFKGGPGSQGW